MKPKPLSALNHFTVPVAICSCPLSTVPTRPRRVDRELTGPSPLLPASTRTRRAEFAQVDPGGGSCGGMRRAGSVRHNHEFDLLPFLIRSRHRAAAEPAAALEHQEQDRDRDDLGADAEEEEVAEADLEVVMKPGEVLAEDAGQEAERQEDGGDHGELLHD